MATSPAHQTSLVCLQADSMQATCSKEKVSCNLQSWLKIQLSSCRKPCFRTGSHRFVWWMSTYGEDFHPIVTEMSCFLCFKSCMTSTIRRMWVKKWLLQQEDLWWSLSADSIVVMVNMEFLMVAAKMGPGWSCWQRKLAPGVLWADLTRWHGCSYLHQDRSCQTRRRTTC